MTPTQRAAAERLAPILTDIANTRAPSAAGFAVAEAGTLLRELLAEPVQEPVAWGVFVDDELFKPFNCKDEAVNWFQAQYNHGSRYDYLVLPLYAAPQQPMHCPKDGGECGAGGYCRPQQRKPLTDEKIKALVLETVYEGDSRTPHRDAWSAEIGIPFARAVERAHGITGETT